ncbi:hypothetical protein DFH27DRAFT_561795 [Peziza echinospora]|nr:hypothetical protein DFH27DRAFT_561795 [Peziza echinospora]
MVLSTKLQLIYPLLQSTTIYAAPVSLSLTSGPSKPTCSSPRGSLAASCLPCMRSSYFRYFLLIRTNPPYRFRQDAWTSQCPIRFGLKGIWARILSLGRIEENTSLRRRKKRAL